jgi:hypothetical protein
MAHYIVMTALLAGQAAAQLVVPPDLGTVANVANAASGGPGAAACNSAQEAITRCKSLLGDLSTAPPDKAGQCLCCSGSSYVPDAFDQYA